MHRPRNTLLSKPVYQINRYLQLYWLAIPVIESRQWGFHWPLTLAMVLDTHTDAVAPMTAVFSNLHTMS